MMYCGRLDEVFGFGGGESSLSGDFSLFMCFLSQDLIGVFLASSSSSMMASLSGSSDLETLPVIASSSHHSISDSPPDFLAIRLLRLLGLLP